MSPLVQALLGFFACAAVVVAAGTTLARSADLIAARTALGGLWVGSVFLAIATSLPELTTDIAAIRMGVPDLALGDLFGSSMANMLILGLISLLPGVELFRRAALDHVLAASLAIVLTCVAAVATLLGPSTSFLGMGAGPALILLVYVVGTRAIYLHSTVARAAGEVAEMNPPVDPAVPAAEHAAPPLRRAVISFLVATVVILVVAPLFATFASRLAELTGLEQSFVGTWLVGFSTSLPELVTCIAALRMGAHDLAVGNLFGSNAFNMALLLPLDAVHRAGPLLEGAHPVHAISALVAVVLMAIGLAAIVYQAKGKMSMLEPSAGLLVLGYVVGLAIVFSASSAPG